MAGPWSAILLPVLPFIRNFVSVFPSARYVLKANGPRTARDDNRPQRHLGAYVSRRRANWRAASSSHDCAATIAPRRTQTCPGENASESLSGGSGPRRELDGERSKRCLREQQTVADRCRVTRGSIRVIQNPNHSPLSASFRPTRSDKITGNLHHYMSRRIRPLLSEDRGLAPGAKVTFMKSGERAHHAQLRSPVHHHLLRFRGAVPGPSVVEERPTGSRLEVRAYFSPAQLRLVRKS